MAKKKRKAFSYEIKGLKKLEAKIHTFQAEALAGQVEGVRESVFLIHRYAVEGIMEISRGKIATRYSRGGNKRTVVVSKPGDPPNTDTGRLVQSIKFDFKNKGLIGRVGTNLKYGAALEFGSVKMAKRPWLSPALARASEEIGDIMKRNLQSVIKGVKK